MLNKENYVPWSSCLLRYAKSRPNGKLIYNSIINGPYVRRMIPKPSDANREVRVNETFLVQTDDELTEKEFKQVEANDQAIQTILLGPPEDIYAVIDSCETAQEIWLRVQQMMKGFDIKIQEKRLSCLMNRKEKIASILKFLNNLQLEWSRYVTIVHQTKDLYTVDYTQLYDFLKYNQKEVDELRSKRLGKTHDPLVLMANSNNPFNYPVFHQDQPSSNLITAMIMARVLMAKAFKLNYSTPTNNNQRISSNPRNRQIAQPVQNVKNQVVQNAVQNLGVQNVRNQNRLIVVPGIANQNLNRNGNVVAARSEGNEIGNNRIQLQAEEFDLMAAGADLDEIEEVNANYILTANLKEKKKLKSGFKIREDELLDKKIQLKNKIKKLDNILVKTGQSVQTMHMLSPKQDSFYHTEQKMARGYQNLFYLKEAQQKQQSLYNGKVLLGKHDSPAVYVSKETLQLAQESRLKMKQHNKEIKPINYTKINDHLGVFVSQTTKSRKELYVLNTSKTANDSKSISILNEEFSDDATPSVARKFLNEGLPKIDETHALSKSVTSNSVPTPRESKVVKNDNVITPGMFRIIPFKPYREDKSVPNKVRASTRIKPITIS
uniref:Uncharacterized protein n=1 Tax=Tanacetum cinerariifolium TaxID=118510 RepID=A0A6L2MWJ6_TANCI|nr:hypothetical protein [Tanacetum cinerariifolium]